ncbi:MAG: TonB-dependent receptor [Gammaproteobacteria bacterium]|nr:TonB-dependent receptor [Gammaproteobacteria bacterium]
MHRLHRTFSIALAMAVGAFAYGTAPQAAAQEASELEEIIVTARKREEALADIPIAITAFSAEELIRGGFTSLEDLSFQTAGMHFHKQGGQIPGRFSSRVRFRGMNTNANPPSQQVGTVFLDGVYVSDGVTSIDFSNIERVEIIKGPQSATFGRSTFAGAVNYVTKTPGFEYAGRVIADVAEWGGRDVTLSHEGPLVDDKLAYRISARVYGTDGQYVSNADGGALGEESTETIQAVLNWTPTSNFSAKFRYLWSHDDDGPAAGMLLGTAFSARFGGAGVSANAGPNCFSDGITSADDPDTPSDYFCGALPMVDVDSFIAPNTAISASDQASFRRNVICDPRDGICRPKLPGAPLRATSGLTRYQQRAALLLSYDFDSGMLDGHGLDSVVGWSTMRAGWVRDFDLTAAQNFLSQDPVVADDLTVELNLSSPQEGKLRYSLGANFFTADNSTTGSGGNTVWGSDGGVGQLVVAEPDGTPLPEPVTLPGPHYFMNAVPPTESNDTIGIFGSFAYDFTDDLTLDVEWRYQEDDISLSSPSNEGVPNPGGGIEAARYDEESFSSFLPRITLSYDVGDRGTSWVTYSEGTLPGIFNADFGSLDEATRDQVRAVIPGITLFNEEEELENVEVGFKQEFDNFYFSAVFYMLDWSNLKTRQGVTVVEATGVQRVLNLQLNAGDAELEGLELEGGFSLGENFSGTFVLNYADGEYGTLTCGFSPFKPPIEPGNRFGPRDCSGSRPARYPEWSGAISGVWTDSLAGGNWDYYVRADAEYFGEAYNEEANFSTMGDFWRVNVRGGFEMDDLRIEGYVKNLLDDDNYLAAARWSDFSGTFLFAFLFSQGVAVTPAEKRTFGLRVVYDF